MASTSEVTTLAKTMATVTVWSTDINDYDFIEHIEPQFYTYGLEPSGLSQVFYSARLTARALAGLTTDVKPPFSQGKFAIEVTCAEDNLYDDIKSASRLMIHLFETLPRHPNIANIEHFFTAYLPIDPPLIDWPKKIEYFEGKCSFTVRELLSLSLQDVIDHRKKNLPPKAPLFRPQEVLNVARDISSALCCLNKALVAHRDIKPANIWIRLPTKSIKGSTVTREQVLNDINCAGVELVLASFGSIFDFHQDECKEMKKIFSVGESRGGASITLAPEIEHAPRGKRVVLDYTKADVWSLGLVLATMMCTSEYKSVVDIKKELLPSTLLSWNNLGAEESIMVSNNKCMEIVRNTVTQTAETRWTCYDVYNYVTSSVVV